MSQQAYKQPSLYVRKDESAYTPQETNSASSISSNTNKTTGSNPTSHQNKSQPPNAIYQTKSQSQPKEDRRENYQKIQQQIYQPKSDHRQDLKVEKPQDPKVAESEAKPKESPEQLHQNRIRKIVCGKLEILKRFGVDKVLDLQRVEHLQQLIMEDQNLFHSQIVDPHTKEDQLSEKIDPAEAEYPKKKINVKQYDTRGHNHAHQQQARQKSGGREEKHEVQRNMNFEQTQNSVYEQSNYHKQNNQFYQEEPIPQWATSQDKPLSSETDLFQEFNKDEIKKKLEKSKKDQQSFQQYDRSYYNKMPQNSNNYNINNNYNHNHHHGKQWQNNNNNNNKEDHNTQLPYPNQSSNQNNYKGNGSNNNNNNNNNRNYYDPKSGAASTSESINGNHNKNLGILKFKKPDIESEEQNSVKSDKDLQEELFDDIDAKLQKLYKMEMEMQKKKAAEEQFHLFGIVQNDLQSEYGRDVKVDLPQTKDEDLQTIDTVEKVVEIPQPDVPTILKNTVHQTLPSSVVSPTPQMPPQILQREPNVNPPIFVADEHRPFSEYASYFLGSLNKKLWYYIDLNSNTQGPFSSIEMDDWNQQKYFPKDLPIYFDLQFQGPKSKESYFSLEQLVEYVKNGDHQVSPPHQPFILPPPSVVPMPISYSYLSYPPLYGFPQTTFNPYSNAAPMMNMGVNQRQPMNYAFSGVNYPSNYYPNPMGNGNGNGGLRPNTTSGENQNNNNNNNNQQATQFQNNRKKQNANNNHISNNNNNVSGKGGYQNIHKEYYNNRQQQQQQQPYQVKSNQNQNYNEGINQNYIPANSNLNGSQGINENVYNPSEFPTLE